MQIIPLLLKELEQESAVTQKFLERVPNDKFDWKPHEKSMTIRQLSTHLAEIPAWVTMGFNTTELDFAATPYKPTEVHNAKDLVELHQKSVASGKESLEKATEEDLLPTWTVRHGDHVLATYTKYEVVRFAYGQIIHHRAQLGVFLRLLDIPIPGTYGSSADEKNF